MKRQLPEAEKLRLTRCHMAQILFCCDNLWFIQKAPRGAGLDPQGLQRGWFSASCEEAEGGSEARESLAHGFLHLEGGLSLEEGFEHLVRGLALEAQHEQSRARFLHGLGRAAYGLRSRKRPL